LAAVIRQVKPDLVALQEVDNRTERTGRVDQTARLAELTGLTGRFARQIDFEGGEYGQAFLSRYPVSDVTIHWLPGRPERQRRIAPAVSVDLGDRKLTFVSTHLHHADATFREEQAEELNRLFAQADEAVIIAGDLNARPDSPPLAIVGKHWKSAFAGQTDAYTFPADKPDRQIDYVLYRAADGFRVKSAKVLDEPLASDHRPLLVEFEY
jgi:endonuclease/exonuclease/phosphatase family metal-dependent hydrolase